MKRKEAVHNLNITKNRLTGRAALIASSLLAITLAYASLPVSRPLATSTFFFAATSLSLLYTTRTCGMILGALTLAVHTSVVLAPHWAIPCSVLLPALCSAVIYFTSSNLKSWLMSSPIIHWLVNRPCINTLVPNLTLIASIPIALLRITLSAFCPSLTKIMQEPDMDPNTEPHPDECFPPLSPTGWRSSVINTLRSHPQRSPYSLKLLRLLSICLPSLCVFLVPISYGRSPAELFLHLALSIYLIRTLMPILLCYPSNLYSANRRSSELGPLPPDVQCLWMPLLRNTLFGYSLSLTAQLLDHASTHFQNHPAQASTFWSAAGYAAVYLIHYITPMLVGRTFFSEDLVRRTGKFLLPELGIIELAQEASGHQFLSIFPCLLIFLVNVLWIPFACDSTENLLLLAAYVARDLRDGWKQGTSVLTPLDIFMQHHPTTAIEKIVHGGKHLTIFEFPLDALCALASSKLKFCYPNSRAQDIAGNTVYYSTCLVTFFTSVVGGVYGLLSPAQSIATTTSSVLAIIVPGGAVILPPQDKAPLVTPWEHWLRFLVQSLHQMLSSSALLFQGIATEPESTFAACWAYMAAIF